MSPSAEKPILTERIDVGRFTKPVTIDPYNRRFKLIGWTAEDVGLVGVSDIRACTPEAAKATKAIVYSKNAEKTAFETLGFYYEAVIEGFFEDGSDAHLFSCFFDAQRGRLAPAECAHESVRTARTKEASRFSVPPAVTSRRAMPTDAVALNAFLSPAFRDYPTPIDPDFLHDAMRRELSYFRVAMLDGEIVASVSAEIDHKDRNAEVSDCVSREDMRGKGLVSALIQEVERDVNALFEIKDFYSLARAGEVGMNCAFAKCGYRYTGRLINNCRMPNGWESIHVWCRSFEGF